MCIDYLLMGDDLFFFDKIALLQLALSHISQKRAFAKSNPGRFFSTSAMDSFHNLSIIPRYFFLLAGVS
jgi:hypothetical protein